jgi:putative peptidoglycan lipid II flippase
VLNDLLLVVGSIVVVGALFTPWIVDVVAPGFRTDPGKAELTILLTRILFPFLLFVALAAVAMGILNARMVFGVPAAASSFFNLGSIVGGLACAAVFAPEYVAAVARRITGADVPIPRDESAAALVGMALGTLLGGALQFLVQVPALRRVGFRHRWLAGFADPGVRQVLRLMGPATIGTAAVQLNVMVNTYFASNLGNGPVSWLNVAFRLMYLPIGMFGVALGTVVLPGVARAASRADMHDVRLRVGEALQLLLVLCIPAAVGLAVASEPIIALIYEHGRFTEADTRASALALSAYAIGLSGYAAIKVLGPAFYALNDARTPMRVSLMSVAVNLAFNWMAVTVLGFGHAGLALSTATVALWNSAFLFVVLRRRTGAFPASLAATAIRVVAAAAIMGLACHAWIRWATTGERSTAEHLKLVLTTVPLGAIVFAAAGRAFGVTEIDRLVRTVRRRGRPPASRG